jgi:hypothetical protein
MPTYASNLESPIFERRDVIFNSTYSVWSIHGVCDVLFESWIVKLQAILEQKQVMITSSIRCLLL